MRNILVSSVASAGLFFAAPVYAMEISADASQIIQEYNGHAKAVFMPKDEFRISSDQTSKHNDLSVFSGNVIVMFKGGALKADMITVKKQADGATLLEADKFSLQHVDAK